MPDIALGVSVMTLREHHMGDRDGHDTPGHMALPAPHLPPGPCPSTRLSHGHSCKRHAPEPKLEAQAEFPDLYDFSCRPTTATSSHPLPPYAGPDLYSHSSSSHPPPYMSDSQGRAAEARSDPLRLDVLGPPPQRQDGALANPSGPQVGAGHVPRGRSNNETDLTHGLGHLWGSASGNPEGYEEKLSAHSEPQEEMGVTGESTGSGAQQPHINSVSEEANRDRRSPNKPDYPYKKSAL